MTTEDKLKALSEAGKEIDKKATDEEIEMAYLELEIEQEGEKKAKVDAPVKGKSRITKASEERTEAERDEAYRAVLKSAKGSMGDKDPAVIEWCRENLSTDEFEAKYAGRIN